MESSVTLVTGKVPAWKTVRSSVSSADSVTDISSPTANTVILADNTNGIGVIPAFDGASDSCTVHVIGYPRIVAADGTATIGHGAVLAELSFAAGSFTVATTTYTDAIQSVDIQGLVQLDFIVNTISGTVDLKILAW